MHFFQRVVSLPVVLARGWNTKMGAGSVVPSKDYSHAPPILQPL